MTVAVYFPAMAVVYGALAVAAVPVADRGGLTGLWVALCAANVVVALGQALAFHRESARVVGT